MTYGGWANRSTWNASLWLNNEEHTYRAVVGKTQRMSRDGLAEHLKAHGMALIAEAGAERDDDGLLNGIVPSEVDWVEVAEGFTP